VNSSEYVKDERRQGRKEVVGTDPGQSSENWADQITASIAAIARARYPYDIKKRVEYFNSKTAKLSDRIWSASSSVKRSSF